MTPSGRSRGQPQAVGDRAARVLTPVMAVADDVFAPGVSACYATERGKVRNLAALHDGIERQEPTVRLAWSLGNASNSVSRAADA